MVVGPTTGATRWTARRPGGLPGDRQRVDPVDAHVVAEGDLLEGDGEPEARQAAQQGFEGDLEFHPGQRLAQALVDAEAEGDMAARVAADVEGVASREHGLV